MDRELIVQAIENAYAKNDLRFQVIWHKSRLHIYINRAADNILDYAALIETVEMAIVNLRIYELEGFWLYSRVIGEVEPDWQTYIEIDIFPTTIGEPKIAAVLSEHLKAMPSDSLATATETLTNSDDVESEKLLVKALTEDEQLDSIIDFDLSNQLSVSHELEHSELDSVIKSNLNDDLDDSQNFLLEDTMKSLGLSSYCFIYNKSLLEGELLPPTLEIAKIVRFFHNLPQVTKHQVLPLIDDYFRQAKSPSTQKFSVGIQQWFEQITSLQPDKVRKASIWLSRYCLNSEATMSEVQNVLDTEAARSYAANIQANLERQADSLDRVPAKDIDDELPIYLRILEQLQALLHNKIVLPLIWTAITALFILLGVNYANSSVYSSDKIPAICQNAIGSTSYCKLAVDLIGEKAFEKIVKTSQSAPAFTPDLEKLAVERCERYANLKAGIQDSDLQKTPVMSSSGELIFPQIYVTEAEQNLEGDLEQETIRVGCVYGSNGSELLPVSDVIPRDWPQESYQRTVTKVPSIDFGGYYSLMFFSINTLLIALGIVIANVFNLGIRISSPPGIYLTAIALGIVVLLTSYLPMFNSVASIALQCLTLVLANSLIKGFKIQWKANVLALFMGASIIVVVTSLFYWLFIEFIYLFIY